MRPGAATAGVPAACRSARRTSGLFRLENNVFFLQPLGLSLNLRLNAPWLRCRDCGRLYEQTVKRLCPACLGAVIGADPDYLNARAGYYRQQLERAFDEGSAEPFGLSAAEHSAQLTGREDDEAFTRTEKYELRFQDIPVDGAPPIDVLSCTTTMEVGIDIGTLCGVALRNVPPHVANYQQRAGRAGRRGKSVASVVTYAHGTSHDAHYYGHPGPIISGDVLPPVVYVENQQVLRRHINAYLVQRFFHETVTAGTATYKLFESLGTVEQFLSDEHACSLRKLREWLQAHAHALQAELRHWVPSHSHRLNEPIAGVEATVTSAVDSLVDVLTRTLPVDAYRRRDQLTGIEREVLDRQLEERLLDTLIGRAIFPRYAFPTDVVGFWVSKRKSAADPAHKRSFEYEPQRDLQVALSECAPGSTLTIDKFRFVSAALFSPYEPTVGPTLQRAQDYAACSACGYVTLKSSAGALTSCPNCHSEELFRKRFIVPQGFAPDTNEPREVDRGDTPVHAGRTTYAQIEVEEPPRVWDVCLYENRCAAAARAQSLVTVNKGIGNRGFTVCPECGRTEPVFGKGYTSSAMTRGGVPRRHLHPLEHGVFCDGRAVGPYYLGHRFPTDVLLVRLRFDPPVICPTADRPDASGKAGRTALTSLVEAVALAASRTLQIDEGELAGNWSPVLGGGAAEVYMFLYDLLPGGAGYTKLVREHLDDVLAAAERLLADCDCDTSCYRCLRHYNNHPFHSALDRHLALAALAHVRGGVRPALVPDDKERALRPLAEFLRLRAFATERNVRRGGVVVPLVIARGEGAEIWVDAHHPLIDPAALDGAVRDAATAGMAEFCSLDAFTLQHDLPNAVRQLQLT